MILRIFDDWEFIMDESVVSKLCQMIQCIEKGEWMVWEDESLNWFIETRSVPLEVTDALEIIANQLNASGFELLTKYQDRVKETLKRSKQYRYVYRILFTEDEKDVSEFEIALLAMEIRRLMTLEGMDKRKWSIPNQGLRKKK